MADTERSAVAGGHKDSDQEQDSAERNHTKLFPAGRNPPVAGHDDDRPNGEEGDNDDRKPWRTRVGHLRRGRDPSVVDRATAGGFGPAMGALPSRKLDEARLDRAEVVSQLCEMRPLGQTEESSQQRYAGSCSDGPVRERDFIGGQESFDPFDHACTVHTQRLHR